MDGGAWQAAVHGIAKSRTQLRDFTFTFHFLALEKEMATHTEEFASGGAAELYLCTKVCGHRLLGILSFIESHL